MSRCGQSFVVVRQEMGRRWALKVGAKLRARSRSFATLPGFLSQNRRSGVLRYTRVGASSVVRLTWEGSQNTWEWYAYTTVKTRVP